MTKRILLILSLLIAAAQSAEAGIYLFRWDGVVTLVEGNGVGSDIAAGDPILAQFTFDLSNAVYDTTKPSPGDGIWTSYNVMLDNYYFRIGDYVVEEKTIGARLVYTDDQFEQDFINFSFRVSAPGPFGSTTALSQLIAQGPGSVLSSPDISNGFPYDAFPTHRLFVTFFNDELNQRVYGDLNASVTEVPEPSALSLLILALALVFAPWSREARHPLLASRVVGTLQPKEPKLIY